MLQDLSEWSEFGCPLSRQDDLQRKHLLQELRHGHQEAAYRMAQGGDREQGGMRETHQLLYALP
jgi:hypothetical protein